MKDKAWSHLQNVELGESGKEVVAGIVTYWQSSGGNWGPKRY